MADLNDLFTMTPTEQAEHAAELAKYDSPEAVAARAKRRADQIESDIEMGLRDADGEWIEVEDEFDDENDYEEDGEEN